MNSEVAGYQRAASLVEHGEIGIGVGRGPCLQDQPPITQVESDRFGYRHHQRRWHQLRTLGGGPQQPLHVFDIDRPAIGQRAGQPRMPDKGRTGERRVAEQMIGMDMRVDDIGDRQGGALANGRKQVAAFGEAAAAVDHRHVPGTDDEGEIGEATQVGRGEILMHAAMHQQARCDFQ